MPIFNKLCKFMNNIFCCLQDYTHKKIKAVTVFVGLFGAELRPRFKSDFVDFTDQIFQISPDLLFVLGHTAEHDCVARFKRCSSARNN